MEKLSAVKQGTIGTVVSIQGDKRFLGRITSIGISIGCEVEVLQNPNKRPLLLYSRDTMIAINRQESEKIMLEVVEK